MEIPDDAVFRLPLPVAQRELANLTARQRREDL
jgi:hypothetical protein